MTHHVYINKNYVLRKVSEANPDNQIDVQLFQNKTYKKVWIPRSLQELELLLKGIDKVYGFYEVQTKSGLRGFDIVIDE